MEYTTTVEMHRKSSATLEPTINKIIPVFWLKKKPQINTWHTGVSQGLLCGMNEGLHEIYIQIPPQPVTYNNPHLLAWGAHSVTSDRELFH